jgi:hypothetical protein
MNNRIDRADGAWPIVEGKDHKAQFRALGANGEARNQLTHLDEKEPEQVEAFRSKARAD